MENIAILNQSGLLWPAVCGGLSLMMIGLLVLIGRQRQKIRAIENEMTTRRQAFELEFREERDRALAMTLQNKILESRLTDSSLQSQNIKGDLERQILNLKNDYDRRLADKDSELRSRDERIVGLEKRRTELESIQNSRIEEYNNQIRSLVQAREDMNEEKKRLKDEEAARVAEVFERKKAHWQNHEKNMVEHLRNMCTRLGIVFFEEDSFPLAKKPDFAIELGEQLVIFDAKAPADPSALQNFPEYLRKQSEAMEKYLKQEGVRREGFLVVPSDVIAELPKVTFEVSGYRIFVVCLESLEAIVQLFLKIDEFETLETVDPQAQEDLAAYIGRATRVMKRRIQVDHYMSNQLLDVLLSGEQLPAEILEKAKTKEKAFTVNPPRMDRGKNINLSELVEHQKKTTSTQVLSMLMIDGATEITE